MEYITLNEKLITTQRKINEKKSAEIHADKTIEIDSNHPLALAHQKALKEKSISTKDMIKMIENGEFDD